MCLCCWMECSVYVFQDHVICVCVCICSVVSDSATLYTVAHQASLPIEFSRQAYWSQLPFPSPGDLPDPWNEFACLMSPALADWFFTISLTWEAHCLGQIDYFLLILCLDEPSNVESIVLKSQTIL